MVGKQQGWNMPQGAPALALVPGDVPNPAGIAANACLCPTGHKAGHKAVCWLPLGSATSPLLLKPPWAGHFHVRAGLVPPSLSARMSEGWGRHREMILGILP